MNVQDARPDPKETIEIIDVLMKKGFDEERFKHHLGDSLICFRTYCSKIQSFRPGGSNHKLALQLRKFLDAM
jgi:hypothetical protein